MPLRRVPIPSTDGVNGWPGIMVNEEHVARLKQGVAVWNVSRFSFIPHLSDADLPQADLRRANLSRANLHLARQQTQLSMTELREQETVRIALTKAPQTYWELSFVNEDGGRQTRLEATSGSYPSEHTLALARACAA